MKRHFYSAAAGAAIALFLTSCGTGPAETGSFDRTLSVTGPIRLELSDPSGAVRITGGASDQLKIHAEVHARGWLFQDARKSLDEVISHPPIEQRAGVVRIGKDFTGFRNVSIDYVIEAPEATEIDAAFASGSVNIRNLHGPVKVDSASGEIRTGIPIIIEEQGKHSLRARVGLPAQAGEGGGRVEIRTASGEINVRSSS